MKYWFRGETLQVFPRAPRDWVAFQRFPQSCAQARRAAIDHSLTLSNGKL